MQLVAPQGSLYITTMNKTVMSYGLGPFIANVVGGRLRVKQESWRQSGFSSLFLMARGVISVYVDDGGANWCAVDIDDNCSDAPAAHHEGDGYGRSSGSG
eukprot:755029-Hanusia_phi.AAC.24